MQQFMRILPSLHKNYHWTLTSMGDAALKQSFDFEYFNGDVGRD
jgi:hypothetical protein